MAAIGEFLFRYRNALFPFAYALLLLPGPRLFGNPMSAAAIGALAAVAGQLVRVLTIGLRYIVRGGRGGRVYADDLVTEGVYGLCRNPMYTGNMLLVTGLAIASNSFVTLMTAVPLVVFAYSAIVAAEEAYLRNKFGAAFDAYCQDVPRWLPDIAAARQALATGTFHWRRVIVKEYGTPFGWINALCLVALYNLWRRDALWSYRTVAQGLLVTMGLVTMLWLAARILKKTRRVVAD
ncbi:MAG TPA: isoprenylcysteine carboxylmethyltransferase family protein [Woeseiaceae bacterium]|nr:isoprenylcysteine carboxylmethyltransferase family protein [Woeseiaceae bacterium]